MNIKSKTQSIRTLALGAVFAATASFVQAQEQENKHIDIGLKELQSTQFPQFVCWRNDEIFGPLALFTQSLYAGGVYGTDTDGIATADGFIAYDKAHIENVDDPQAYGVKAGSYLNLFEDEIPTSFEEILNGFSEFDRAAIRESVKAFRQRENQCPAFNPAEAALS